MLEIKTNLAPEGSKCRPGMSLDPTYITIHNTANTNTNSGAETHGRYLNGSGQYKSVSWHYAVDDKCAVNCIPENECAWHAGDGRYGRGNRNSLAIEICENPESDLLTATNNAAELTAMLMKRYNIPISRVVQHHHWSGKNCPHLIRKGNPYTWEVFLQKVVSYYSGENSIVPPTPKPEPVKSITEVAKEVLAGKWGNGSDRIARLTQAGYDAKAVQAEVNRLLNGGSKPAPIVAPDIKYQVFSRDKWWGWVTNYNNSNSAGYAGLTGYPVSAIRAYSTIGHVKYRVHTIGGKWYGWVTDYNTSNSNGYAGIINKPFDKIQMTLEGAPGYVIMYRVHTKNGKWYGWVRDYNNANNNGYAGISGKSVDKIQMKIVKQ